MRTGFEQALDGGAARISHALAIVEHEKEAAVSDDRRNPPDDVLRGCVCRAKCEAECATDVDGRLDWRKVDEHRVVEVRFDLPGELERQLRLPHSAGSGQREQPDVRDPHGKLSEQFVAANQRHSACGKAPEI